MWTMFRKVSGLTGLGLEFPKFDLSAQDLGLDGLAGKNQTKPRIGGFGLALRKGSDP